MLVAKATALLCFLVVLEVVAVPAFFLLLLGPSAGPAFPELLAVLALADVGLAVVGTLVAGLAVQTRARDLIGPLLTPAPARAGRDRRRAGHVAAVRRARCRRRCEAKWLAGPGLIRSGVRTAWRRRLRLPPGGLTSVHGKGLRGLSIATAVTLVTAFALVFFYAPAGRRPGLRAEDLLPARADGDRGAVRVRLRAGSARSRYLRTGDRKWDLRSYVAIHLSLILGIGVLITGVDLGAARRGATGGCGTSRRWSRS